jgi:hypothetical protein
VYSYLDRVVNIWDKFNMGTKVYTTREIAIKAGISRQTLQTWIAEGRVKAPPVIAAAGLRLWTKADLALVLEVKPRNYPRKEKPKKKR